MKSVIKLLLLGAMIRVYGKNFKIKGVILTVPPLKDASPDANLTTNIFKQNTGKSRISKQNKLKIKIKF